MLYTIINECDVFYTQPQFTSGSIRSSNPYDYIRCGYFVDNASLYGGKNNVSFNSYITGNRASALLDIPDFRIRS